MKGTYVKVMDGLYLACMAVAGLSLTVMTLIIPVGVYWRYVLNTALSWPEPLSVLLVVLFTFSAGAACYRANVHISVILFTGALPEPARSRVALAANSLLALLCAFMLVWGIRLVETTWNQVIAEFPFLSVGVTYLPIPISGALTLLFIAERIWIGPPPRESFIYREPTGVN